MPHACCRTICSNKTPAVDDAADAGPLLLSCFLPSASYPFRPSIAAHLNEHFSAKTQAGHICLLGPAKPIRKLLPSA